MNVLYSDTGLDIENKPTNFNKYLECESILFIHKYVNLFTFYEDYFYNYLFSKLIYLNIWTYLATK